MKLLNYNSSYAHGCLDDCPNPCPQFDHRKEASRDREKRLRTFLTTLSTVLNLTISFQVITDCPDHPARVEAPPEDKIMGRRRIMSYQGTDIALLLIILLEKKYIYIHHKHPRGKGQHPCDNQICGPEFSKGKPCMVF